MRGTNESMVDIYSEMLARPMNDEGALELINTTRVDHGTGAIYTGFKFDYAPRVCHRDGGGSEC
jgi:hypothetical protein